MKKTIYTTGVKQNYTSEIASSSTSDDRLSRKDHHYLQKRSKRKYYVVCSDRKENGQCYVTPCICSTCINTPGFTNIIHKKTTSLTPYI